MAVIIGSLNVDQCAFGVVAPATSDLQIGEATFTRTHTAMLLTENEGRNDIKELLLRVEALELNSENDKELQAQATALIQAQLSSPSPSPSEKFLTALNSIATGTTSSALGASIATFIAQYLS